jgi:hypothetical protein
MGRLLDANFNAVKRREERIVINAETQRKMGILSNESAVFIQGVPRRCILRDISFSGAKLIMMGIVKFLEGKEASLRLDFEDPRESFLIKGKFVRVENVESRKDLLALVLDFDESIVPMGYKVRVSDFLGTVRAESRAGEAEGGDAPGGAKTAKSKPGAEAAAKPAQDAGPDDPAAPANTQTAEASASEPPAGPEAKAAASKPGAPASPAAAAKAPAKPDAPQAKPGAAPAKPGAPQAKPAPGASSAKPSGGKA